MNENVDLTKILKDCPKGWEFYSSVYGKVQFLEISPSDQLHANEKDDASFMEEFVMELEYPVKLAVNICEYRVSKAGEHKKGVGECTLFPSKDQRDWSKFTAPWYKKDKFYPTTLKAFEKVLVRDECNEMWKCDFFSHINEYNSDFVYITTNSCYKHCIPYNNDTKHLVGTTDDAPEYYRHLKD